jgi:hypothetical protein
MNRLSLLALLLLLYLPAGAFAQSPSPIVAASVEPKRVQLSESVRLTVVVAGPAPLRVELHRPLLAPEADRDWRIQPQGIRFLFPLFGLPEWECWLQTFRLDPYVTGNAVPIVFAPFKVNGQEATPASLEATVLSTVDAAKPEAARPVTGIEHLPPHPEEASPSPMWWIVAASSALVILVAALRFRRPPRPVPPQEWAMAAFDRLERDAASRRELVDGVAAVVRGYIDRRFAIPAPRYTTQELLVAAKQAGWLVEETDALRRLLEVFDRAKFAGDVPDDDGCRDLLARGRDWVHRIGADARPG